MHVPEDWSKEIFFEFRSSGRVLLNVHRCWLAVHQILQPFSFFIVEFFLVSAFFAFVLEKVIVKCLISVLIISQRSPLFSRSLYLSIICGIFSAIVAAYVIIIFWKKGIKFLKAWSSWLLHFFLNFHAHWRMITAWSKTYSHLRTGSCCWSCFDVNEKSNLQLIFLLW